jgi:hypothetical protein
MKILIPCSTCRKDSSVDGTPATCVRCLTKRIETLEHDRLALAKVAADSPQFFNPVEAMEAKALRDDILAGVRR